MDQGGYSVYITQRIFKRGGGGRNVSFPSLRKREFIRQEQSAEPVNVLGGKISPLRAHKFPSAPYVQHVVSIDIENF